MSLVHNGTRRGRVARLPGVTRGSMVRMWGEARGSVARMRSGARGILARLMGRTRSRFARMWGSMARVWMGSGLPLLVRWRIRRCIALGSSIFSRTAYSARHNVFRHIVFTFQTKHDYPPLIKAC